jgi:hypothetical protein
MTLDRIGGVGDDALETHQLGSPRTVDREVKEWVISETNPTTRPAARRISWSGWWRRGKIELGISRRYDSLHQTVTLAVNFERPRTVHREDLAGRPCSDEHELIGQ